MNEKTLSKRQQIWMDHLRAAEARGMTLVAYAAANNLLPKDLYNWKSRFIKRGVIESSGGADDFASVRLQRATASCAVQFPNGARVEFTAPLSAQLVELVLARAARLP